MAETTEIRQSRFGVRMRYEFGPEQLRAIWRDASGERSFSVPYQNIDPSQMSELVWNNNPFAWRVRILPLIVMFAGWILGPIVPPVGGSLFWFGVIAMLVALACAYFHLFAVRFVLLPMMPTPPGAGAATLRIIDNAKGRMVIDEIARRRRERLRAMWAVLDLSNEPKKELAKFEWLLKNDIIDEAEYRDAVQRLQQSDSQALADLPPRLLN